MVKELVPTLVLTPRTQVPATVRWIVASTRLPVVNATLETFTWEVPALTVAFPLRLNRALPTTCRAAPPPEAYTPVPKELVPFTPIPLWEFEPHTPAVLVPWVDPLT